VYREACAFRDSLEVFAEAGADVIGVSSDSAGWHAAFAGRHSRPPHLYPAGQRASVTEP
jgi:peroxiredoxin